MKYLEELKPGECFIYKNNSFMLTADFKNNGSKLCYLLNNGHAHWINSQEIIEPLLLYTIDKDNNIVAINK